MATEWFLNEGTGVATHAEDPCMLLVGNYVPDWVLAPVQLPVVGSRKFKVNGCFIQKCPKCKARDVRHLLLEDGYHVAECNPPGCGFVWYKI